MNKNQFLNEFYSYLGSLPNSDKADIMRDFDEHFREGIAAGKTEEQICFELGSPLECAKQYGGENVVATPQNTNVKTPRKTYPDPNQKRPYLWSLMFFSHLLEAVIFFPMAFGFGILGIVFVILDCYLIPAVSFIPFTVLAVSSTCLPFLAGLIFFVLSISVIKTMFKKMRNEVRA